MNTKGVQKIIQNFGGVLTKNSPTILTGLGVAGLITTAVMAVKTTPKAMSLIDDAVYKKFEDEGRDESFSEWLGVTDGGFDFSDRLRVLTPKETISLTWRCYLPAAVMGGVTIACIIGANSINLRRNAALAGLYSLSETALKEYKTKVVETIGKTKEKKIKDDLAKDKIDRHPLVEGEVIITGKGDTLCYDAYSGRYFKSDIEFIRRALNKVSRELLSETTMTLNDVYYELDLKGTKAGELVGWHVDYGLVEPEFSSQLTDNGLPCLVLDFVEDPMYLYRD